MRASQRKYGQSFILTSLLLSFAFLLSPLALLSQSQKKTLPVKDTVRIDSVSIIPGTWKVLDQNLTIIPDSLFTIHWIDGLLIWKTPSRPAADSIRIEYERYPVLLSKVYQHKDLNYNRIDKPVYRPPVSLDLGFGNDRQATGSIRSSGTLSRGLAVGNQRDASLTSNLNLQLEGNLSKDFRIEATLTDSNIPVQPDGNTQQIQEFDKVYMRIYNPKNEILGGDFDIRQSDGYFLRMNKRVQGARFTTQTGGEKGNPGFRSSTGAAIVKGRYARNAIQGREGDQGPYQLTGNSGEIYIQAIAGSEKVFIDGRQLMRGEDADYVMDYNTAEVRFTPKNLITKDKRISVEFEYTERSYARFLLFSENRWTTDQGSYHVSVFSENDAKNQPLLQDLSDFNRAVLEGIGDQSDLARVSSVRESVFNNDRILYKIVDTLVDGIRYDSILVQSFHPDSAKYEASFAFTGAGNGHYRPVNSAANGRVFEWVAPRDGKLQGSYEPVTRLAMPASKQIITAGLTQKLGKQMSLLSEWALSRHDRNTFSSLDDRDNLGMGILTRLDRRDFLNPDSSIRLESFVNYRFTGARFDAVERFREVEFERDWNLTGGAAGPEHLLESGVQLSSRDSLSAAYRLQYLSRSKEFSGFRQITEGRMAGKKWEAGWNGSYLLTQTSLQNTRFLRHQAYYRQKLGTMKIELSENAENNRWRSADADTLLAASRGFQELSLQALSEKDGRQPWMVRLGGRSDLMPYAGGLKPAARALEAESWFDISKNPSAPLRAGIHFRTLRTDTSQLATEPGGESFTARVDNRFKALKGIISSQTYLELGSGSDRKPEYSYLEVAAGQGYYTWNDYNGNGIRELDEFETAAFRDQAAYIRVFRLSNERVPTFITRFNQILTIQPKKGFLSKFSSQFAYRLDRKDPLSSTSFNLLDPDRALTYGSSLRHTLGFMRGNPKFSADLVTQNQYAKNTLINGADGKGSLINQLLIRYRFHPSWQLNTVSEISTRKSTSEFFTARNFTIRSMAQQMKIEFSAAGKLRLSLDGEARKETNDLEATDLFSARGEGTITAEIPGKGQISTSLQYVYIRFNGSPSSPSGYSMLRGFRNGHNGVMQLNARYKLGKNLVLEGLYEGRISGGKPVHNAQIQVRALF
jgi:hypothetical protein